MLAPWKQYFLLTNFAWMHFSKMNLDAIKASCSLFCSYFYADFVFIFSFMYWQVEEKMVPFDYGPLAQVANEDIVL